MTMPFEYILTDLLARTEGAVGALFLDDSGETVDLACSDFTPTQLRIIGAYLGIYLRQLERLTEASDLGVPQLLHVSQEDLNIYAVAMEEGYVLALIQRPPAVSALTRRSLLEAREQIRRELFTH